MDMNKMDGKKEMNMGMGVEMEEYEIGPNSPELQNKNPEKAEYIKMGFSDKEDYERNMRRSCCRYKGM